MPSPDRHFANAAIFTHSTGLTPNSGDAALYIKSDNKAYIKDSAGAEVIVGGTGTIAGTLGTVDNAVPRADGTGGVTAQGSDISIDDATTSTQANVAITNQHTGQTNSALVLTPKGTGAFILGPKPDGTSTGGNARGTNAIDLQLIRASASAVASGVNSIAIGRNCTATSSGNTNPATYSAAIGISSQATGNVSLAMGSSCIASGTFSAAIGESNSATSTGSASIGGVSNQAQIANYATAIGGNSNNSYGANCGIFSGSSNQCSGSHAAVFSGATSHASATHAISFGPNVLSDRRGMFAHGSGQFAAQGDAQRARFVMRNKTTTNSAVELFLDGSSTRLTIPSGKYLTGTINIAGIKSDGATAARYIRQFSIKNVAATTSLVGTVDTVGTDIANSTTISITADDTNDALKVEVTGIASETWRWVASVDVVEVAYGT
jgi:hypothetical protein